jgi:hypothetical protein
MIDVSERQDLKRLLTEMTGSFLQYVAQSWPWSSDDSGSVSDQILAIAAGQRDDIQAIVDHLHAEREFFDLGTYPTDYTDLHYIDVQHLLEELVKSQTHTVELTREIAGRHGDLLTNILQHEEQLLAELKQLHAPA